MPKKVQTNVQFVVDMMEHSAHGALVQAFVLEAIDRYAKQVMSDQDKLRVQMKNHLVHPEAWIGCAKEVNAKCLAHYA